MTTLRVLAAPPYSDAVATAWARYDASGACIATGRDVPASWPEADRVELVIAASHARLAAVTLPPLPLQRLGAAAAFALEDRLAGPLDDQWLAVARQERDGRAVVAVVARTLMTSLRSKMESRPWSRVTRAIVEPELAEAVPGLRWCAPEGRSASEGFVRLADGNAFAVGAPADAVTLPPEIALLLSQKPRDAVRPASVRVDAPASDDALARWHRDTGVAFTRGTPWRWHAAAPSAFASAIDLMQGEFSKNAVPPSDAARRWFVPALGIAGIAFALHVVATLGEWAWWRVEAWRTAEAWRTLAIAAGVAPADADTPAGARAALLRRYANARHAQSLAAPNDALPLFARVAPALASLPPGTLKNATYSDGHWTLDLKPVDASVVQELGLRLRRAGAPAIAATTPAGTRLRIGIDG